MFKVQVPATSANLGPGFDAIGIALNLYNEIIAEPSDKPFHFVWQEQTDVLSEDDNLIYQSMVAVFHRHQFALPRVQVRVLPCTIPIRRGLGSSSAAIVSGLTLAYALMGMPLDKDKLSAEACRIEGHPDNVVPAIYGGLSVTVLKEDKPPLTSSVTVPADLRFLAVVPPYEISTEQSRAALPDSYSRADCIHNAARTALLVNAFHSKDYSLLRTAFEDAVHQPYRLPLMKDGRRIFDLLKDQGSLGEFISGSGSTLMGVFTKDTGAKALPQIDPILKSLDKGFYCKLLEIDHEGVRLIEK